MLVSGVRDSLNTPKECIGVTLMRNYLKPLQACSKHPLAAVWVVTEKCQSGHLNDHLVSVKKLRQVNQLSLFVLKVYIFIVHY